MSKDNFQQQIYDYLHDTRELTAEVKRKVLHYFDRCNFFARGDYFRESWHRHYVNKHNKEIDSGGYVDDNVRTNKIKRDESNL